MPIGHEVNFRNKAELKAYIELLDGEKDDRNIRQPPFRHQNYDENVLNAKFMAVHFDKGDPGALLKSQRPNEPQEIFEYRLDIYEPTTNSDGVRVLNVLAKIQNSGNSSIVFEETVDPVLKENTLKDYVTKDYPEFGSLEGWTFGVALKSDIIDPNALVVYMPKKQTKDDREFREPVGSIFSSEELVDFWPSNYYSILLEEKSLVKKGKTKTWDGNIYLFVTSKEIVRAVQVEEKPGGDRIYDIQIDHKMDFEVPPAFQLKGDIIKKAFPFAWESYASGVLPFWNKVVRLTSDLDVQFPTHMYLERFEVQVDCSNNCEFDDKRNAFIVFERNGKIKVCPKCRGEGHIMNRSPAGATVIKRNELTDKDPLFPGATYLEKPIEIIEVTDRYTDKQTEKGFSALNMDILLKLGDNQSGIAKLTDKASLNDYLLKVSDNMYDNVITNSIFWINQWRYGIVLKGDKLEENLPVINKPTSFDIETIKMMTEEMQNLKQSGASADALLLLERDLIDKKFPNDQNKREFHKTVLELDPLPGLTSEEKSETMLVGGTSRISYVVSINTTPFLLTAISQDSDFISKPYQEKVKKMDELARLEIAKDGSTEPVQLKDDNGANEET